MRVSGFLSNEVAYNLGGGGFGIVKGCLDNVALKAVKGLAAELGLCSWVLTDYLALANANHFSASLDPLLLAFLLACVLFTCACLLC